MNKLMKALVASTVCLLPAQAYAETVLNWAVWNESTPPWSQLADAYMAKNPDAKIVFTDLGAATYETSLQTQMTGGADDLDIIAVKNIAQFANLVNAGLLAEFNDYIDSGKVNEAQYGGLLENIDIDGKVYGLPFRSDFWLLYYNKDHFDAAGVEYPTNNMTFKDFDEKAAKVTSGFGSDKVYGGYTHTWASVVQNMSLLTGEHTFADGEYGFFKPYYERALRLQRDGVVPNYASLKASSGHYTGYFFNGTSAMVPMGTWFISSNISKHGTDESEAQNWGLASLPVPEGVKPGTTVGAVTLMGANANSNNLEATKDFVAFASSPEGAAVVAASGLMPAVLTDEIIYEMASLKCFPQDENSKNALKTMRIYPEMPVIAQAADINLRLNRAHDAIMTESTSIDEALAELTESVQEVLDR